MARPLSVTPRVPDVSTILASGGRTPRYTHTPRNALGSLVRPGHTVFELMSVESSGWRSVDLIGAELKTEGWDDLDLDALKTLNQLFVPL